jgi:kinesin family member 13
LKAVASWDSSVHQSPYLNQLTPFDKHVYITVKVNVKFKLISDFRQFSKTNKHECIDIVLRKRISVCVYLPNSGAKLMSLNRFKNLLNPTAMTKKNTKASTTFNQTCIIYRVISTIPKLITEIENRESLAIKAASSIVEDVNQKNDGKNDTSLENSAFHFERYAKTIEAVDTILKRERIQQKLHLEKLIHSSKNNELVNDENLEDESTIKTSQKTFSVPNLIKNVS